MPLIDREWVCKTVLDTALLCLVLYQLPYHLLSAGCVCVRMML